MKKTKTITIDFVKQIKSIRRLLIISFLLTCLAIWTGYTSEAAREKAHSCYQEWERVQQGEFTVSTLEEQY